MNKKFKLYQEVVLSKTLPQYDLQKGDLATIVEIINKDDKTGYCLEIFDSNGDTLKVIIVDESDISEIKPSIVNYRQLQKTNNCCSGEHHQFHRPFKLTVANNRVHRTSHIKDLQIKISYILQIVSPFMCVKFTH